MPLWAQGCALYMKLFADAIQCNYTLLCTSCVSNKHLYSNNKKSSAKHNKIRRGSSTKRKKFVALARWERCTEKSGMFTLFIISQTSTVRKDKTRTAEKSVQISSKKRQTGTGSQVQYLCLAVLLGFMWHTVLSVVHTRHCPQQQRTSLCRRAAHNPSSTDSHLAAWYQRSLLALGKSPVVALSH